YQDFEIVVVDDASGDNTEEVVGKCRDTRIRYVRHETQKRVAGARNTGLLNSTGQYIAFLDDDDEWLPEKLKMQVDLLDRASSRVAGVYTGFWKIDRASGKTVGQATPTLRGNVLPALCSGNWVGTASTVVLRHECLKRVGPFDESIDFCEDYDMWIRIAQEFEIECIEEPLVKYFVHPDKLSTNAAVLVRAYEGLLRKYGHWFASNGRSCSYLYLELGVLYCYDGNMKKGRKALLKAIQLYPYEVRHYFNLCLSLAGAESFRRVKAIREKVARLPQARSLW
ncbi:MAG: glycosyltransferase, partial [Nitrososphaera sp.]